jgi:hypothetical protein
MGLIRAIFTSKLTTLLSLVAALIGLLTQPEFVGLVPADWSAWLAGVGTFVAALSRGFVDADGDGIPDVFQGRQGNAKLGLMVSLLFLGACGLIGAGSGKVPPASPGVTMEITFKADTASVRMACRPVGTVCRWTSNFGAAPDGPEALFKLPAPAPGDSVLVAGTAYAVRRGLVSVEPNAWSAWVKRNDVPPPAPDSVVVVEIIVPPVVD